MTMSANGAKENGGPPPNAENNNIGNGQTQEQNGSSAKNDASAEKLAETAAAPKTDAAPPDVDNKEASSVDMEALIPSTIPTSMSTTGLELRLRQLREASAQHSQILTQKLASSQSGQNLLHMGTSLSTLPPDLHNMLQQLHPFVSTIEETERGQMKRLETLVKAASKVQRQARRVQQAQNAANLFADLQAAEKAVQEYSNKRSKDKEEGVLPKMEDLDETASLERSAHITLCLLADLNVANEQIRNMTSSASAPVKPAQMVRTGSTASTGDSKSTIVPNLRTPLEDDTESAQFLMKLAPRIRRLESATVEALSEAMEYLLLQIQESRENSDNNPAIDRSPSEDETSDEKKVAAPPMSGNSMQSMSSPGSKRFGEGQVSHMDALLMLGHCMRGLTILGRGDSVESTFARVAIMPLIRSKVSMGRLDEGGSRGECAGLFSLLDEMATVIQQTYGPVLCLAEEMFYVSTNGSVDVDLLTAGVWVPIATALMADTAIKMAIFSPGIASILQANYVALDTFLAELASRLLSQSETGISNGSSLAEDFDDDFLQKPMLSDERVAQAQDRIYSHPKTAEFSKRWNLPIYYQLRFGESCTRLNKAVDQTKREGWIAQVFSGPDDRAEELKRSLGFELTLFLELYDILTDLWRPDVILRPLTNRFLRGAVQLVGRTASFISDSMDGKIKFGEEPSEAQLNSETGNGEVSLDKPAFPTRAPYSWGESEDDVAAVAWELTVFESAIRQDYVETVSASLQDDQASTPEETAEVKSLVSDVLIEASDQIYPIVDRAWNEVIVRLLTSKCVAPLSAVKGVAVMYRMTNRPPPTQPSSFVGTIFRPLKEFSQSFTNRTPQNVGTKWKHQIVVTVSDKYAAAVDELLTTVQRTEVALKNRKARRIAAGGMSDGEKLKLQLYLDFKFFNQTVREVGVDPATVIGVSRLKELTAEGEALFQRQQKGAQ